MYFHLLENRGITKIPLHFLYKNSIFVLNIMIIYNLIFAMKKYFYVLILFTISCTFSFAQNHETWVMEGLALPNADAQIVFFDKKISERAVPIWKAFYFRSKAKLATNKAAAVRDCDSALVYASRNPDIYLQRGKTYSEWAILVDYEKKLKAEYLQRAEDDFKTAAFLTNGSGEADLMLAALSLQKERANKDSIIQSVSEKVAQLSATDSLTAEKYANFLEQEGGYEIKPDTAVNRQYSKGGKPTLETITVLEMNSDTTSAIKDEFIKANEKKEHGKYQEAIEIYTKMIEKKPFAWEAYNNRGVAKLEKGDFMGAIEDFEYVKKHAKDNSWAENNIGCVKYEQGAYMESLKQFQQAIQLDTLNATAYYNLGMVMYLMDKYEVAMKSFNKAITLRKPLIYANAYLGRGEVELDLGMEEEANNDFEQVLAYPPKTAEEYVTHGAANLALKQYNSAIQDCNTAQTKNPYHTHTYLVRGNAHQQMGEYRTAISDFSQGIKLNPALYAFYNARAWAYFEINNFNMATEDFTTLLRLKKDSVFAFYGLGMVNTELKNYSEAHNFADNALKLRKNFSHAYQLKGQIESERKRYNKALPYFDQAIQYNHSSYAFYLSRGWTNLQLGNYETARKDAYTSLQFRKTSSAYNLLAAIESHNRNEALAFEWVKKAFALEGNTPNNFNQKGNIYLRQAYSSDSIAQKALNCYNKAIELDNYRTYYGYHSNRADVFIILKDTTKAIKDLEEAIKIAPREADLYKELGDLYFAKKKYSHAAPIFETAKKLYENDSIDSEVAYICKKIGEIEFIDKNYQGAFLAYSKAIYCKPYLAEDYTFMLHYAISAYQSKRCKKGWDLETEITQKWGANSELKRIGSFCN